MTEIHLQLPDTYRSPLVCPHSELMACMRGKAPWLQWVPEKSSRGRAHTMTPPKPFCLT